MVQKENINLIIEGCLRGNEAAERKLFEKYYGYVKSTCLRYASDINEAEEMINDCFYKVFTYLNRFDNQFDFVPWLRKVSINACLEYIRKNSKQMKFEALDSITLQDVEVSEEVEIDPNIDVVYYLQQLTPAYRTVFNLYVMEEYKHHEIAEILAISVNTSKSNLSRAKDQLRKLLEQNNALNHQKKSNGL